MQVDIRLVNINIYIYIYIYIYISVCVCVCVCVRSSCVRIVTKSFHLFIYLKGIYLSIFLLINLYIVSMEVNNGKEFDNMK